MIPIGQLRLALTKLGLNYVIARVEGKVAIVHVLVREDEDVHS